MANRIILTFVVGVLIGLLIYDWFLVPEIETKVEYQTDTRTKVDRIPQLPELVFIRSPKPLYLRDTVINQVTYPINSYSGLKNLSNGQIKWGAETSGFLNKLDLNYQGEKEVITNTITNTKTITNTVYNKGVYLGAGINSLIQYNVGASYVDKNYIFSYQYQPQINVHQIGVAKKIF